jgi:hypothetical protein
VQLAFIYYAVSHTTTEQDYNVPMLILVLLLSPLVSVGVGIAAWVSGAFWFFNAILGDPAGGDEGRNDGRASVLGVRRWWEKWLVRSLK